MGSNDPAGGSFKEMFHYLQVTKNGEYFLKLARCKRQLRIDRQKVID